MQQTRKSGTEGTQEHASLEDLLARVEELEARLDAMTVENARLRRDLQIEMNKTQNLAHQSQEKHAFLRGMLACSHDAMITLDARHRVLEWNSGAQNLFGYLPEEAVGRDLDDLIATPEPGVLEEALSFTRRAQSGELVPPIETVRYRCDGRPVDVVLAGAPILVQDRLVGTVSVYTDISKLKRAERALLRSEERHRTLVQNIPIGVYRTTPGPDGIFLMANPAFVEMFGLRSEADLDQICASDLYQDPAGRKAFSETVVAQGRVSGLELALKKMDGTPLWGAVTAKAVYDEAHKEVVCFDCAIEDVTGRRRAAEIQDLLYRIANAVHMSKDERELFTTIRQELAAVLDTRNFFIALYNRETDTITSPFCVDERDDFETFPAGKTLTAYVIQNQKPLLASREEIEALIETGMVELFGALSEVWLGVPLEASGQVVGAVVVQSYTDASAFGQDEQEILEFVSSQIGLAIERVQAESALRESELQTRTTIDSMGDTIYVVDRDFKIVLVNAAFKGLVKKLGLSTDVIGRDLDEVLDFSPPETRDQYLHVFETGQMLVTEESTWPGEGELITQTRKIPVIEAGQVTRVVTVARDITRRRRTENEILQLKRFNESIVQNMAEGIAVQDAEGLFTFVNPAGAAMLGYEPDELVGQHWTQVVPPDQQSEIQTIDEQRVHGQAGRYEAELLCRDGARLPVLVSGSPRFDSDGVEFLGTIAVFTDISERVNTERVLTRHAREMAALFETSLEINSQPDLPTLLSAIVERAAELVGARTGGVYLLRPDEQKLELVVVHNLPDEYIGTMIELGEGVSGRVAQTGNPLMITDYSQWEGRADVYDAVPFRRVLGMPLKAGDRVIGVINVSDDERTDYFEEDEFRLVSLFADQAAIAVENARLLESEHEQRELAEALRQATSAVNSTLDLDQTLDHILEQVDRVLPGDAVNILLIENGLASIVRSRGYERFGQDVQGLALSMADTHYLRLMQETGESVVIPDTADDPSWVRLPEVSWIRSYAAAPIRMGDQLFGFLNVDSATPGFFSAAHASRLRAFADQASLALSNAQLFRNVEQAKREWEETFDAMRDPVVLLDDRYHIVRSNRAFAELVQLPFLQFLGRPFGKVLEGMACPEPACPLEQAAHGDRVVTCVHEYQDRVFEIRATPVLDGGSSFQAEHTIYALRDITERRRAEEEIRRRNRELVLLNRIIAASATAPAINSFLDTVCREMAHAFDVPQATAALLDEEGVEATVVAEYVDAGLPPTLGTSMDLEDEPCFRFLFRHDEPLAADQVATDPRLAGCRRLGYLRDIASLLVLPLLVEGEVAGSLKMVTKEPRPFSSSEVDLAQRVADQVSTALARIRLEETRRRLNAAVEQSAEAVIVSDTDGVILYANPAVERITGYTSAEMIGHSLREFGDADTDQTVHAQLWQAVTGGQLWQGRFSGEKRDGSHYRVDSTVTPVRAPSGEIVNYVATLRDVTREVQLERQFHQSQKMEALGRLAGGIAHDFNNLLTVIHISVRLLEQNLPPENLLWDHVQHIHDAGERAAKLTKQLLSFSRRQVMEPRIVDLNEIVADLSRMLQRIIGEDIELAAVLADDLWPVKVDPVHMEQVLMNLVVNARDAMPGGGTLTVETANVTLDEAYADLNVDAHPGEHVMLAISDTGQGMTAEVMAHLFEPFFTTKEPGQGTGLGLSTVFGIVKRSGGHIQVESQVGEGTRFRVYLPRTTEIKQPEAAQVLRVDTAHLDRRKVTILVAEDDASVRNLAVRVLKSHGYRVLVAKDGYEALRISDLHSGAIHLLLADVVMPHMNGRELADELRLQRPELRVLYMSGHTDDAVLQQGVMVAELEFLAKPFSGEALIEKIQFVLQAGD